MSVFLDYVPFILKDFIPIYYVCFRFSSFLCIYNLDLMMVSNM